MAVIDPKRVKQIFSEAIERPVEQRDAFVADACGDDAELRSRVARLLILHDTAGDFLVEPTRGFGPARFSIPGESVGDVIGHYTLLKLIGEGGFGTVYLARQERPVRRQVALKIIKLGMDTRQVIARFEAEKQALAVMDHPNIARVFDAGATDTGRPYFVMEHVPGVPISQFCDERRCTPHERLTLFTSVCSAVQHAHQKGVIHRDIKPSNVLVSMQDDERPLVKVIDFGIAKATEARLTEKTIFTEDRQLLGTPQYMSPEQADLGGAGDVDTRSDIYSLGVLLYELLTGSPPFDPKRLRSAAFNEIQRIIREEDPPRPSTVLGTLAGEALASIAQRRKSEPARLQRLLRGDLDWIVMRAMEKDRARRYETASALADDIRRHLSDEPVAAGPPGRVYRLRKLFRRNRTPVLMGCTVIAAVVAGVVLMSIGFVRAERERDAALAAERVATVERNKAQQVARFLEEMLASVGPMRAQGRDTTLLREILDRTVARVDQELASQPQVRAHILNTVGGTYRDLALFDEAEKTIRASLDVRRQALGDDHPATIQSLNALANVLLDRGDYAAAEPIIAEVIQRRRTVLGPDDMAVASALNDLSYVHQKRFEFDDAERVQREVLRIVFKNVSGDHPDLAASLNHMAQILELAGKYDEAEKFARDSLDMRRRLYGDDHSETALSLDRIGRLHQVRGRLPEAEAVFRDVLRIRRRVFGEDHPEVATALNNVAAVLVRMRRYDEAEPMLRQALAIRLAVLGEDHPGYCQMLANLAALKQGQGEFAEAERLLAQVRDTYARVLGPHHPSTVRVIADMADLERARGNLERSAELWSSVLAAAPGAFAADHPAVADFLGRSAETLTKLERFEQAETNLLDAHRRSTSAFGESDARTTAHARRLLTLYNAWGKPEQAAKWRAAAPITPATAATPPTSSDR